MLEVCRKMNFGIVLRNRNSRDFLFSFLSNSLKTFSLSESILWIWSHKVFPSFIKLCLLAMAKSWYLHYYYTLNNLYQCLMCVLMFLSDIFKHFQRLFGMGNGSSLKTFISSIRIKKALWVIFTENNSWSRNKNLFIYFSSRIKFFVWVSCWE